MSEIQNEPIFGEFNGESMTADDGRLYPVPGNYASKSKLSEGDKLKLVFEDDGSFVFKQIDRQECKRLRGIVNWDKRDCYAMVDSKKYHLLYQSATYFHLQDGDEVIILVPRNREVSWAAVENVMKKTQDDEVEMTL